MGSVTNNISSFQDFWEYDPVSNVWTQKAGFGGSSRYGATGFAIYNKGYVGLGISGFNLNNDLWQYDPVFDSWNQKANMPVQGLSGVNVFVLGNRAYILGGIDPTQNYSDELWEYNSNLLQ